MEVRVTPDTAKKLQDLAATSGRAPEDIVEDALAGYLEEVASVRKTLDSRYDDLKSGRVKPIGGEEAFRKLREKSEGATIRRRTTSISGPADSDVEIRGGSL
jgi:predicted transcriptional regulator